MLKRVCKHGISVAHKHQKWCFIMGQRDTSLKSINIAKQFAKEFSGQLPEEPGARLPEEPKRGKLLSFILLLYHWTNFIVITNECYCYARICMKPVFSLMY